MYVQLLAIAQLPSMMAVTTTSWSLATKLRMQRSCFLDSWPAWATMSNLMLPDARETRRRRYSQCMAPGAERLPAAPSVREIRKERADPRALGVFVQSIADGVENLDIWQFVRPKQASLVSIIRSLAEALLSQPSLPGLVISPQRHSSITLCDLHDADGALPLLILMLINEDGALVLYAHRVVRFLA